MKTFTDPVMQALYELFVEWREPDEAIVGHIPKGGGKEVDFLGHAIVTRALLESDPRWTWEPLAFTEAGLPAYDNAGGLWIKLTVHGTTRLGYGTGVTPKHRISDALKVAAMRFGVALSLWAGEAWESMDGAADSPEVDHVEPEKPKGRKVEREPLRPVRNVELEAAPVDEPGEVDPELSELRGRVRARVETMPAAERASLRGFCADHGIPPKSADMTLEQARTVWEHLTA